LLPFQGGFIDHHRPRHCRATLPVGPHLPAGIGSDAVVALEHYAIVFVNYCRAAVAAAPWSHVNALAGLGCCMFVRRRSAENSARKSGFKTASMCRQDVFFLGKTIKRSKASSH
jgi:hypothetical protein